MPLHPDEIHYITQGTGQPVILIHGVAASSAGWSALLPSLVEAGLHVFAPDLPGHGDSHKSNQPDHYHIREIFLAFEGWIKSLSLDQPFLLVGHSLGGHLSLCYSLAHPDRVSAMALIDPFFSPKQLTPAVHWLARRPALGVKALRKVSENMARASTYLDMPFSGAFPPSVRTQIARDLTRAAPEILHVLPTINDLTPLLSQIQPPTLVIYGDHDMTLRPASFPHLARILPHAYLRKIKGAGHTPHLTRSNFVNQQIIDFFTQFFLVRRSA